MTNNNNKKICECASLLRCSCGETQTMSHVVNDCITTRFPGGLTALHLADEAAVHGLGDFCKS